MSITWQRSLLLIGILGVAAFFRLHLLVHPYQSSRVETIPPGLFSDEAMNGNNAHETLSTGHFKIFYRENNGREGFFINLQAIFVAIFGHTSYALRGMSAVFGILTVLALYFFAREYTQNEGIALIAAFLLSTSFWHVVFSRMGFRAIMAPFFLTAGLAALYYTYNHSKTKNHNALILISAFGGLLFGLGFHSYIAYRVSPLLLIPVFGLFVAKAKETKSCVLCIPAIFLLFTFLAGLPLGYYFLQNQGEFLGRTSQISIFSLEHPVIELLKNTGKTLQMFYFAGDYNSRHNIPGKPALWWPVAIFFTIGIFESIRKRYVLLFAWLGVMLLPVALSSEGLPHALRSIIMIPPVFMFAAIGFWAAWAGLGEVLRKYDARRKNADTLISRNNRWLRVIMILILISIAGEAYYSYFYVYGTRPETAESFSGNLYATGLFLRDASPEIPKYVVTGSVDSIDLTGRPMELQPILYASESYLPDGGQKRNIHYITKNQIDTIDCSHDCMIVAIDHLQEIFEKARSRFPTLMFDRDIENRYQILVARPK